MNELKQKIISLCNESGLPLEALTFVLKDAWRDAEAALAAQMQAEAEKPAAAQLKEEEK